ncbi:hypothetical protein C8Q73DRAFT_701897 [Cubamyces lactineus]|nr:hypothetical protein C8Q73DRAFT_701897 [Cubamyces lactineus]
MSTLWPLRLLQPILGLLRLRRAYVSGERMLLADAPSGLPRTALHTSSDVCSWTSCLFPSTPLSRSHSRPGDDHPPIFDGAVCRYAASYGHHPSQRRRAVFARRRCCCRATNVVLQIEGNRVAAERLGAYWRQSRMSTMGVALV